MSSRSRARTSTSTTPARTPPSRVARSTSRRPSARRHERPDYTIDAWVDFPGARYVEEDGEAELLPGVRLIPTPGHTPGHQSLVVDSVDGRTVLVGQALYTRAEWDGASGPGVSGLESAWDPAAYRASVARLRALQPDVVLFGHDR